MNRPPSVLALAILAALPALACAPPPVATSYPTRLEVPVLAVGSDASWTGRRDGEAVVAEVGGIPIPEGRYRRALQAAGPGADAREVLNDVIARELIAQEAVRTAPDRRVRASEAVYQRALVSRMLRERLVDVFHPDDVPESDLQEVFRNPQVSGKFNHLRLFTIEDYQWICCGGDARSCGTPDAIACFAEGTDAMTALLDELQRNPPDAEDIPLLVEKYRTVAPHLTYQEYNYAWDDDRQMQRGAVVIDPNVVEATRATREGHFAGKVVRSKFGVHIPYVREMMPPVRRGLDDPEVRKEVSEFFFPRFQQKRLIEYMATLIPTEPFRMMGNVAVQRGPSEQPRYPVTLYPDTLNEAMEAGNQQKEKEPM